MNNFADSSTEIKFTDNFKKHKELNKTLIKSYNLFKLNYKKLGFGEFNSYFDIIWNLFSKSTNITKKLNSENVSQFIFLDKKYEIFKRLKKKESEYGNEYFENNISDIFLVIINDLFIEAKKIDKSIFHFIFYTNISKGYESDKMFNSVIKFLDIKLFSFKRERFAKFRHKFLMLDVGIKGKYEDVAFNEAYSKMQTLYGYLTFCSLYNKENERGSINHFSLSYNLIDLDLSAVISLDKNYEFLDKELSEMIMDNNKILTKSKNLNLKRKDFYYDFYIKSKEFNKKKLDNYFDIYLKLYYLASVENSLDSSFLKFWSLSEKILKDFYTTLNDESLVKKMEKVLKLRDLNIAAERVDIIKYKRNKLVHENINNINQLDRNLSKTIADSLLWVFCSYWFDVDNIRDYSIFIDNLLNDNIDREINLLKDIMKYKNKRYVSSVIKNLK